MSRGGRSVLALAAAGVVLAVMSWFDSTFMRWAAREAAATFDPTAASAMRGLGSFVAAGAILTLAVLGWQARSLVVGAVYLLVGAFFAFLSWIGWAFAAQFNDTPPVLPDPFPSVLANLYHATDGPLNAVGTIGAAMAIAGVAVILREVRHRSAGPDPATASAPSVWPLPS